MKEEIFGPILPVIAYDSLSEAENIVRNRKKPLALYIFTQSPQAEKRPAEPPVLRRLLHQRHSDAPGESALCPSAVWEPAGRGVTMADIVLKLSAGQRAP